MEKLPRTDRDEMDERGCYDGGGDTGAVGDSLFQTYRVYYSTSTPVTTADSVWDSGDDGADLLWYLLGRFPCQDSRGL